MAQVQTRCSRCHEVVEATDGVCPRCGANLPTLNLEPPAASYAEKYRGTAFAAPEPLVVVRGRSAGPNGLLVALGAILLVTIVGLGGGYLLLNGSGPPERAVRIVAATELPTPPPSLPAAVASTMATISDTAFSAHLVVDTAYSYKQLNSAKHVELDVSHGDARGTESGPLGKTEFVIVKGATWSRQAAGKWRSLPVGLEMLHVAPLLDLTDEQMLSLVGEGQKDGGAAYHLRSTKLWRPDIPRLAMISGMELTPETIQLDLWVALDGRPISASVAAGTKDANGGTLESVRADYTFSNVGREIQILPPGATPQPSASK